MAFTGNEDHSITLADAAALTARYRQQMSPGQIKAGFFGRKAIEAILAQPNCAGIRIYFGLNAANEQELVLVDAMANENDMENGVIAENVIKCPPICPAANPLNS
jgi:hypothetical protein